MDAIVEDTKPHAGGRFARVREILRGLFEGRPAHQELGAIWQLPHEQLLVAQINQIRLFAPPRETSCCGCSAPAESRSERSGLIQGLRGAQPFDGKQLPPLPWGGPRADDRQIQFLADWIDDGCPDDSAITQSAQPAGDAADAETVITGEPVAEEHVAGGIEWFGGSPGQYAARHGDLLPRVNIDGMTPGQLDELRAAFRELYELNKWPEDARNYNNLALIHQNHCQHGWERFLPWHRVYLYEFEQALQDRCPGVTLPYWDWTMPQYRPETPEQGDIIPRAFKAFLTPGSLVYLEKQGIPIEGLTPMLGKLYTRQSEFFAEVTQLIGPEYAKGRYRERFIDALLETNSLWYPLRYPAQYFNDGKPGTINQVIHYHYPSADDIEQIMSLRTFRDFGGGSAYNDAFGFLDQNPHNTLHIWTGGMNPDNPQNVPPHFDRNRGVQVAGRRFHSRDDLYSQPQFGDMFSNLTASYDPVFWPIHVNVDRLWWEWQQRHPDSNPADLDAVLTPWSYTVRDTLDIHRFGYEYVRGRYDFPVGLGIAVGRFVSRPIPVANTINTRFQRAEVRLQRVPQLPRSCFIRVFLNLPDANAGTPLDDPHYAGYLAIFGHGPCYGGPGHCDLPGQPREYDRRPRSHNTPRNHRIDVSKCARRLIADGAESLQITLVVIGADYREERELLRLEGVSLNFLD